MPGKIATFGVFGRPSIGKSSIVAALTENDDVEIDDFGGTTREVTDYPLEVEGRRVVIFDTPGFEKAQQAFDWLRERADASHQRSAAILQFLKNRGCSREFPVETALLRPIMEDNAAILYVADDSRRFTPEYEAEIEILRWTGQARMGLLNPFGEREYAEDWRLALRQHFDVVQVFNPLEADFGKKLQIFESFCHIKPEYRTDMLALTDALKRQRDDRLAQSLDVLAEMLVRLCTNRISQSTGTQADADKLREGLEEQYRTTMAQIEKQAHERLLRIYNYRNLDYMIKDLPVPGGLFDVDKPLFQKVRRNLSDRLPGIQPKFEACVGPIRADQCDGYAYPVLDRYLFLFHRLQNRTHATQGALEIQDSNKVDEFGMSVRSQLSEKETRYLERDMNKLCRQRSVTGLQDTMRPLLTLLAQ